MLVLSRRAGERILIEGGIEIILLRTTGRDRASIGVIAPPDVRVQREERVDVQRVAEGGVQ